MALFILITVFGNAALVLTPIIAVLTLFPPSFRFCPELRWASVRADHDAFDTMMREEMRGWYHRVANHSMFEAFNSR